MLMSWLADKLFRRKKESSDTGAHGLWAEWDARRMAVEEAGNAFAEPEPGRPKSGRRRWRRGRPSAWTQEPLALPGLFWWARILTTGMATATVVSTVVFTAGVATRVAGFSGNMKGAPALWAPLSALAVGRRYPVMRSR